MLALMKIMLLLPVLGFALLGFPLPGLPLSPVKVQAAEATRTLIDMSGREVTVPAEIKRVVPLGGALRYLVYLRSLDLVVGVENIERRWTSPGRLYGLVTAAPARDLPLIGEGGPGRLPDYEQLLAVDPEIIITMGMERDQAEAIQNRTGLPVFTLNYGEPGVLESSTLKTALNLLGQLLGRGEEASRLSSYLEDLEADLAARRAIDQADNPAAYVGAISHRGTRGINSTQPGYPPLVWAGGRNVAAAENGRGGHIFIDPESLLLWDPETIFIDAGSLEQVREDYRRNPGYYRALSAVRRERVFLVMPYNFYHTNIEIAYANAYFIGQTLHPQRFNEIDPAAKADEIFQHFIGLPAYEALKGEYHGFGRVRFGERDIELR
ncbi:MAG TPA: iron ABC transporter substrate-binding protein [Desulfurivibrio alkaliphilus]|uniref:Iron ABC transporter substrate-binding protein n=1 Tax=Desulfurivibrio alkaliphilus TaxID=427923 RepID=A0A7C2XWF9_9BACT|nr:iron ABC transporter substrate-binding protein [Desulfurivibrio alkaliphilus]